MNSTEFKTDAQMITELEDLYCQLNLKRQNAIDRAKQAKFASKEALKEKARCYARVMSQLEDAMMLIAES